MTGSDHRLLIAGNVGAALLAPSAAETPQRDPMLPATWRVTRNARETQDTFTLHLEPVEKGARHPFLPGQFNMLYAHGVGEAAISISGPPDEPGRLVHTIRAVGQVTRALQKLRRGDTLGVRGPFGTPWDVAAARERDVLVIAGGIGLAPLRPVIYRVLAERAHYARVAVLAGARTPEDLLFARELESWRGRFDVEVEVTVDRAQRGWFGNVGVVTARLPHVAFDPAEAVAFLCGPQIMMEFAARDLLIRGVPAGRIQVSMERNMKCGIGHCGHCQWGPEFVCKDGPVFPYERIRRLLSVRDL